MTSLGQLLNSNHYCGLDGVLHISGSLSKEGYKNVSVTIAIFLLVSAFNRSGITKKFNEV
jgi:hypothetical protein